MRRWIARSLLCLTTIVVAQTVVVPSAGALAPGQRFGVADQNATAAVFQDPRLTALQPTITRYIADYDVALTASPARDRVDRWYAGARANRQRMLIAFGAFVRAAPSQAAYRAGLEAFHQRYPEVTEWEPMNEANHETQPTWNAPQLAARYTLIAREVCPRCTLVQLSLVLGFRNAITYTRSVLAALPRSERRRMIFGLHTYSDSNHGRSRNLARFLRAFPTGRIWFTEAAALAVYRPRYPLDLQRQAAATALVFRQAIAARRRVQRLYWYEWDGPTDPAAQWDSGLIDGSGGTRPAYAIAKRERFRTRLTSLQQTQSGLAELARASRGN